MGSYFFSSYQAIKIIFLDLQLSNHQINQFQKYIIEFQSSYHIYKGGETIGRASVRLNFEIFFLFNFIFFSHYSLLTSFQLKPPHPLDEKSNMESSPSCGVIFIGLNSPSPTVFSKQESLPLSRFTSQDLSVSLSGISKILALHLRFLFSFKSWMRTLISPNLSFFKP